jgi:trimethylamine:corrinoid methyltransferase-like protein
MIYRPRLTLPYADGEMEAILSDALGVLKQIGIACGHHESVARILAHPGVAYDGKRLKFEPDLVAAHVEGIRRRNRAVTQQEPPFEALASWACLNICDPETGQVRPPTTADAAQMTRLMDARGCGDWSIPVIPADADRRQTAIVCEYVALTNSRRLGGFLPVTDVQEAEFLIAMNRAVGRTYRLVEQVSISPLRFNDHGLAMALAFQGRDDVVVTLTGAIPGVGVTVPFPVRSALVENAAESLALSIAVERLGFGRGGVGLSLQPYDFQHATMVFGGPEWMLYDVLNRQMYEFLNRQPQRFGAFRSIARMPDPQAAAERSAALLWQALLGARRFRGAGQLAVDEVFSPQQVVIDDEMLAQTARVVRGLDPQAGAADVLAEVAEGLEDGTYMDKPSTARAFRDFCIFPPLFHRYNVGHWRAIGRPTVLAEAWEKAKEQIRSCDFQLSASQSDELERVYAEALRAAVNRRVS